MVTKVVEMVALVVVDISMVVNFVVVEVFHVVVTLVVNMAVFSSNVLKFIMVATMYSLVRSRNLVIILIKVVLLWLLVMHNVVVLLDVVMVVVMVVVVDVVMCSVIFVENLAISSGIALHTKVSMVKVL